MALTAETVVKMYIKVLGAEKVLSLCHFTREEILASLIKKDVFAVFSEEEVFQYLLDKHGPDKLRQMIDRISRKQSESHGC